MDENLELLELFLLDFALTSFVASASGIISKKGPAKRLYKFVHQSNSPQEVIRPDSFVTGCDCLVIEVLQFWPSSDLESKN